MRAKKTKVRAVASVAITPATISTTNFARDIAEYKAVVDDLAAKKGLKEMLLGRMKTFMRKYLADKPVDGTELASLVSKIEVYKKRRQAFGGSVKILCKEEGYHFNELASNRRVMRIFKDTFGEEVCQLIEDVAYAYGSSSGEEELDEEATAKARAEFETIAKEYDELTASIAGQEIKVNQMKEYVSFYKDLASIAAISRRSKKDVFDE